MIPVLQVIGSKRSGGAENFFRRLVTAQLEAGWPVAAITPPDCSLSVALQGVVPLTPIAMRGNWDVFSRRRIRQQVKRQGYAVVQTWMGRATRLTHLRGLPDTVHVARLGGYYNLKGYRHADAWIGNTRGICDYLLQHGLPAGRVFHVGNFFDPQPCQPRPLLDEIRMRLGLPPEAWVLFALGRLHPNKGFDTLLQAVAQLGDMLGDWPWRLLIAGDGPLRQALEQQARELGVAERVQWLGWVERPSPYFQLADLFICPSRHEPLGNVILEAWGNQTPLIATRSQGPAELIEHGLNGWLVDKEDPGALAEGIRGLLADPAGAQALAREGSERLARDFSRETILGQYQQVYAQLAG